MAKRFFLTALLVAALCMARQNDQKSQDIRAAFAKLRDHLYNDDRTRTSHPSAEDAPKIAAQMDALVGKAINSTPAGAAFRSQDLASELKALLPATSPSFSNTPVAEVFDLNGAHSAALAYLFFEGRPSQAAPHSHSRLDFYRFDLGEWKLNLRTPIDDEFNGCEYFVSRVNADDLSKVWFVLYGMRIGDSGARRKVLIYSYDNASVKKVWERRGLYGADISVVKNVITVEHDRAYQVDEKIVDKYQVIGGEVHCVSATCQ